MILAAELRLSHRRLSLLSLSFAVCCLLPDSLQNCNFPEYLWSPVAQDSVEKYWTSEITFPRDSLLRRSEAAEGTSPGAGTAGAGWTSQQEMGARATKIFVKRVTKAVCLQDHTNATKECPRKDLQFTISCLAEELDEKFRVQVRGVGEDEYFFGCMKFVPRGKNVVQVWTANRSRTNDAVLCHTSKLRRDPWPWIAHRKEQWVFCPFVGGFDFQVNGEGRKKSVCRKSKHRWRPMRMESECILGEGIHVQFPDYRCSTLDGNLQDGPLYCWGSWVEHQQEFVLIGRIDQTIPQFVMKLPTNSSRVKEFNADLFFSPVAILDGETKPTGVQVVSLRLRRSDPGVCYDESQLCPEFSRNGKCVNSALHKYANFCKKSCGLCGHKADLVPSVRSECFFPEEYRGRWLLFESDRLEHVTIEGGNVTFSKLGSYICKSKHWKRDQYKMLSVYEDGCRPRYSCMHFRLDGLILYFQMSRSSELDKSFELCEFRDDPEPLRDKIRSRKMKLLLPETRMHFGSCGLGGRIRVNASFPEVDVSCAGELFDWDTKTCQSTSYLSLNLTNCRARQFQEYKCVVHMDISDGTSILITQGPFNRQMYQCWVLHTHSERMSYRPWKQVFVFDKGQCGSATDLMSLPRDNSLMTISTHSDIVATPCSSQTSYSAAATFRPWQASTPVRNVIPPLRPTPARPPFTQSNRVWHHRNRPTEPNRRQHDPKTESIKYGDTASRLTDFYSSVVLSCCLLVVSKL